MNVAKCAAIIFSIDSRQNILPDCTSSPSKMTAPHLRTLFHSSYKSLLLTEQAYMKNVWQYSVLY